MMNNDPPIAVVGMAGLFPGAPDLTAFWRNLKEGRVAIGEVPESRWVASRSDIVGSGLAPDRARSSRAGLIDDAALRGARESLAGLGIGKPLRDALDPLYPIAFQTARAALADCVGEPADPVRVGVVLAAIALPTDSASGLAEVLLGRELDRRVVGEAGDGGRITTAARLGASVTGLPAALISAGLELGGPAFTLDAACASSLYAVYLACDALADGRADAMLAGGVSRPDCLYTQVGFSQLRALSPSGRCAPFDADADGLVVGEGAGLLVLKRLADARADGDRIYAVIRGLGLSNDIRGNLLAPDTDGQVRAMRAAYRIAGWEPSDVDLIECHGAGTPVGDGVELRSLSRLWGESGWRPGGCPIGSVKSMIGHLLTAAGAAGTIKTILGLYHRTLPPSAGFNRPGPGSPLIDGPFRVQREAAPWPERAGVPRRAAVSAFGFGGINAHLLLESPTRAAGRVRPDADTDALQSRDRQGANPIAIVGMGAAVGPLGDLDAFGEAVFNGRPALIERPVDRWRGADGAAREVLGGRAGVGGFMDELAVEPGEFRIPPNEIPDILPQQLLALRVAADALADAGMPLREKRPRMGTVIGIDFDYEATDFHLRWRLHRKVREWRAAGFVSAEDAGAWREALQDASGPPLTATRTVGALGGIVASRVAREFRFGGPSFGVSEGAAGGLRALAIGFRMLQRDEVDAVLVAAVDLAGDLRAVSVADARHPFSAGARVRPFDRSADGPLPADGAAAVILRRRDRAEADGDRIYAMIRGVGSAGGGILDAEGFPRPDPAAGERSLAEALSSGGMEPADVSLVEVLGSGAPALDAAEASVLARTFEDADAGGVAIGAATSVVGYAGAAAGLISLVKAGLSLHHRVIPPLPGLVSPRSELTGPFHVPAFPQFWFRDRADGPRRAVVGSVNAIGTWGHVVLEEHLKTPHLKTSEVSNVLETSEVSIRVLETSEVFSRPLGPLPYGLFPVEGDTPDDLLAGLDRLADHLRAAADRGADVHGAALEWHDLNGLHPDRALGLAVHAADLPGALDRIRDLRGFQSIENLGGLSPGIENLGGLSRSQGRRSHAGGASGFRYSPAPLGPGGRIAFVYPGSGNHYLGMGRGVGARWPEIIREMDAGIRDLRGFQSIENLGGLFPDCFLPRRSDWEKGWEAEAHARIISDPLHMIFGQVAHGGLITALVRRLGVRPDAAIGYSLGESAAYFALGAWPEREEMLRRMRETDLFTTELAGPCRSAREMWELPPDVPVKWRVAVVNRPAETVRTAIQDRPLARLLIVNTPSECVIGGQADDVAGVIRDLGCEGVYLDGVVTVHCDAALPAADAYRALHVFPTHPPEGVTFYSCPLGRSHTLTTDSAADSILKGALEGFDFPETIRAAYDDGVRIFLEMGPGASCTRMIGQILADRPHLAVSACVRGEPDELTVVKFLAALIAERVPVDLSLLYGDPPRSADRPATVSSRTIRVPVGRRLGDPPPPPRPSAEAPEAPGRPTSVAPEPLPGPTADDWPAESPQPDEAPAAPSYPSQDAPYPAGLIEPVVEGMDATARAHRRFLDFSTGITRNLGRAFDFQSILLERLIQDGEDIGAAGEPEPMPAPAPEEPRAPVAFDREQCMAFAVGSVASVLGPEFAEVDTYPARVRLPDEPLMLVDRILSVSGEKGGLGSGTVVTEHDVLPGAWYLDGDRAPVCISVEAGQADLFLCAYLGIDLRVRGERTYRLLDARVRFHRGLPRPGETIRYEIAIDRFVRHGETWLFFFRFEGTIAGEPLISMRDGCAGFFTEAEVNRSGGIILSASDREVKPGRRGVEPSIRPQAAAIDDNGLDALRRGDLAGGFGPGYPEMVIPESLRLPGGRMKLIHRILSIDPDGGRYGIGSIRAEADVRPDDWYLTCHFVDDMVMPGTLMYECCAHALRVLLQSMGWVTERQGVVYEPVIGEEAVLKCRGPVTPRTRKVIYEVEISGMDYGPEPYVVADANMYADGHRIVRFTGMSMKMTGITGEELEAEWLHRRAAQPDGDARPKPLFDRKRLLAFCEGNPSEAFGEPYRIFDRDRVLARLPRPPYFFMDRVVSAEPEPWVLRPDGWIEAEYDVPPDAWYFRADRSGTMPFCVLLEIALQPCGFLAAYVGSALRSESDLKFRNLGGRATIHQLVNPDAGRLTMRARLTRASEAGQMIIEDFEMAVLQGNRTVYAGETNFGFFTKAALANQVGIRDRGDETFRVDPGETAEGQSVRLPADRPRTPDDSETDWPGGLAMPAKALLMIDEIDCYLPEGGPQGLGYLRGIKRVDPDEWFFRAHFYQDPVCPGSLGIESFIQLLRHAAIQQWPDLARTHRLVPLVGREHQWTYRGQIIQSNRTVTVEAVVTHRSESPHPVIRGDGRLSVDGLVIYRMTDIGVGLIEGRPAFRSDKGAGR